METTAPTFSFSCVTCQASAVDGAFACPCGAFFHADCATDGRCPSCGDSLRRPTSDPAVPNWPMPLLTVAAVVLLAAGALLL